MLNTRPAVLIVKFGLIMPTLFLHNANAIIICFFERLINAALGSVAQQLKVAGTAKRDFLLNLFIGAQTVSKGHRVVAVALV